MRAITPSELTYKAVRNLRWALIDVANLDDAGAKASRDLSEKAFSNALASLAAACDAISAMFRLANREHLRQAMLRTQETDRLLRYLKHARHLDVHHYASWKFGSTKAQLGKIDPDKFIAASKEASIPFERMLFKVLAGNGVTPDFELAAKAGVEIAKFQTFLSLGPFSYINERQKSAYCVGTPSTHLGTPCDPTAQVAIVLGSLYFLQRLNELRAEVGVKPIELFYPEGHGELVEEWLRNAGTNDPS